MAALLAARVARTHGWLLDAVADLGQADLEWRSGPTAPPIGFHLWHAARWSDRLQAKLPQMLGGAPSAELWTESRFSAAWAPDPAALGFGSTGMGMDEEQSAQLPLAAKDLLVEYARAAFEACDQGIAQLRDLDLLRAGANVMYDREDQVQVGATVLNHISHITRHLGMMEALRGVTGRRGSVTI